jgi:hypothetical protein
MNNNDIVQKFVLNATSVFDFLEKEYGYKITTSGIENEHYFPDAQVTIKYANSMLAIEVFWYFASAMIGIAFIKLQNGKFPENSKDASIINLYALAGFLSQGKEDMFVLKDIYDSTFPKIKKREKIINEKMVEVLENLALGVKKYALGIISGDTSCFPEVQKYQMDLINRQYS